MPNICLNMIVRNEADRILRALEAAAPHITSYCIIDTGSTDETVDIIRKFFDDLGTPGVIDHCDFIDFSQARNFALNRARKIRSVRGGYLLLQDADMELRAEDGAFKNLKAPAYSLIQKSGALSYHNIRLVRADAHCDYIGVTHEYLNIEPTELSTAYFIDHADGSNRADKFERDINLLTQALKTDPENGRYWFYLGQSYRDAGRPHKAVEAYAKRVSLGGWDEETWNARVNLATAYKDLNQENKFIATMLEAYNFRPQRAEALYDLAKFFREKGDNNLAVLFASSGMKIPRPNDKLFVNDYVYSTGLKEEFSISSYYNEALRGTGAQVCDDLSLDLAGSDHSRGLAKSNMYHYLRMLGDHAPSFRSYDVPAIAEAIDYVAMNPSVVVHNGMIVVNVRKVNYRIADDGSYQIKGRDGSITRNNAIDTRNFVMVLDEDLAQFGGAQEIKWPRPPAAFDLVTGLEDVRLISAPNGLFGSACVREQNPEGWCEQYLFGLDLAPEIDTISVAAYTRVSRPGCHEKNWMPILNGRPGMQTSFMYRPDVFIPNDANCPASTFIKPCKKKVDAISGSSQLVPFNGGYLAVLHESAYLPNTTKRYYQHRFAWFDSALRLGRLSLPFCFHAKEIEFCAGLAIHPETGRVIISYGVRDEIARLATVDALEVTNMLWAHLDDK